MADNQPLNAVHAPANPGFASTRHPSNGQAYLREIGMGGPVLNAPVITSVDLWRFGTVRAMKRLSQCPS
jgi:hypothetical protein